ncbi:hypothetical protein [Bradyrhizobium sp. HKCCYLS20291]|uniref:hypothetical protein n=1 Tax=Bradyrhizobium sp. HKCCYLS20291 TaxID=3420766 RepID=UPI003EB92C56
MTIAAVMFGLILAFAPYLYYEFNKVRKRSASANVLDYEDGRNVSNDEIDRASKVNNSNIACDFQLLTVYPNVLFGVIGNFFVPILNAISFFVGGYMHWKFLEKGHAVFKSNASLHSFIGNAHSLGSSRSVLASISLVGFGLLIAFELTFLAHFLHGVLGFGRLYFYLFVFMICFFLIWFTFKGGQKTALQSDQWYLIVAYIGIHSLIFALAQKGLNGDGLQPTLVVALCLMTIAIVLRFRDMIKYRETPRQTLLINSVVCLATGLTVWAAFSAVQPSKFSSEFSYKKFSAFTQDMTWSAITTMMMAAVAPALVFRYVDFSLWLRNRAIYRDLGSAQIVDAKKRLPGTRGYFVEAALTYVLPLLVGAFLSDQNAELRKIAENPAQDVMTEATRNLLADGSSLVVLCAALFLSGIIAIAMSTLNTLFVASAALYGMDMKRSESVDARARFMWCLGGLISVLVIAIDLLTQNVTQIVGAMIGAIGVLMALAPLVTFPMFCGIALHTDGWRRLVFWAVPASGVGFTLFFVIYAGVAAVEPTDAYYWIAAPGALLVSGVVYLCGLGICGSRIIATAGSDY